MQFSHEKFSAYQNSIKLIGITSKIITDLPKGNAHIADQLKRASISVSLNIAEGSGKISKKNRKNFYSIARGSALECAAILDVLSELDFICEEDLICAKGFLMGTVRVLSAICLDKA